MLDKLPKGWVQTTLGEIRRDASMGFTQQQMRSETFELYSVPAFDERKPEILAGEKIGSNKKTVAPGDVLLCKINPRINRAWVVAEPKGHRQIGSTEWIVFSKQEGVVPEFLAQFFGQDTFRNYLSTNVSGVGGSLMRVRPAIVEKYPINLPPFREQERIVTKLDALLSRVTAGEAAARRALERLSRYRAAVLHAAVTGELTRDWRKTHKADESGAQLLKRLLAERRARWEEAELKRLLAAGKPPKDDGWKKRYPEPKLARTNGLAELPRGWVWTSVDQLATGEPGAIQSGPFGSQLLHSEFVKKGILAIGIDNVLDGSFSMGREHRITAKKYERLKKFTARPLDVVITVMATVGRVCVLPEEIETAIITKHCYRISPPTHTVDSRYLALTLRADATTRQHLFGNVRGQTRAGINGGILKGAPMPLPSFDEQREIIREVERRLAAADLLTNTLNRQLDCAQATRQSLLREAFAGKLVVQDPKDEPGSVLLDRIRAAREEESKKPKIKRMTRPNAKPIRRPLLDVLREHKKPMTPEQLFREAGFQPKEADSFYRELASLRKVLQEKKPSGADAKAWPLRAKVLLQLKED